MKIISKYKDYYDYLVGKYGEDPLIVLDRRDSENPKFSSDDIKLIDLYIGGKNIQGIYIHDQFYYGENIEPFSVKNPRYHLFYNDRDVYRVRDKYFGYINVRCKITDTDINEKLGVPILMRKEYLYTNKIDIKNYYKFPILKNLNLASFIEPDEMWLLLSNFLSKKDLIIDNRTNNEKIIDAGFDLKESFRGKQS